MDLFGDQVPDATGATANSDQALFPAGDEPVWPEPSFTEDMLTAALPSADASDDAQVVVDVAPSPNLRACMDACAPSTSSSPDYTLAQFPPLRDEFADLPHLNPTEAEKKQLDSLLDQCSRAVTGKSESLSGLFGQPQNITVNTMTVEYNEDPMATVFGELEPMAWPSVRSSSEPATAGLSLSVGSDAALSAAANVDSTIVTLSASGASSSPDVVEAAGHVIPKPPKRRVVKSRKRQAEIQIPDGCDPATAKKLRRQQRNREAAQQSRDRQKKYVEEVSERLNVVTTENTRLKQELVAARTDNALLRREIKTLRQNLDSTRSMADIFTKPLSMSPRTRATAAGGVLLMVLFGISLMVNMGNPDGQYGPMLGQLPMYPSGQSGQLSGLRALPDHAAAAATAAAAGGPAGPQGGLSSTLSTQQGAASRNLLSIPVPDQNVRLESLTCQPRTTPGDQQQDGARVGGNSPDDQNDTYLHLRVPASSIPAGARHALPSSASTSSAASSVPLGTGAPTSGSSSATARRRFVQRESTAAPTGVEPPARGGRYRVVDVDYDTEEVAPTAQDDTKASAPSMQADRNETEPALGSVDETDAKYVDVRCQVVNIGGRIVRPNSARVSAATDPASKQMGSGFNSNPRL